MAAVCEIIFFLVDEEIGHKKNVQRNLIFPCLLQRSCMHARSLKVGTMPKFFGVNPLRR